MAFNDGTAGTSRATSPSILVLASDQSQGETVKSALSGHDLSAAVTTDVHAALETISPTDVDCVVVSGALPSFSSLDVLDRIRAHDPLFPVVFLLDAPTDEVTHRLESSKTASFVNGDVETVSYDHLADRIRTVVATYRESQAHQSKRDVVDRLEERLYQTERKITALHDVAMRLNSVESADNIYQETVRAAEEILHLDICFAFAAAEDQFVPKAQSSTPTEHELEPIPLDAGVMGETHSSGQSFRAVNMDLHALAEPEFGDYQSGISVPIGEFGVFQAVSKTPGAFDEIDLELTELLTSHAASVIHRLRFEEALRVERDRYATLFENSADCIIEAEFDGDHTVIRSVNPAFESVFGYTEDEVRGKDVDEVVVGDTRLEEARALTKQVKDGEFVQTTVRRQADDGLRDFLLRSVPASSDTLYAVYTDITDQKDTERTIEEQKERLDAFASTVSHDLQNPLSIALGRLELARSEVENDHLDAVARALERIQTLSENLLTLARKGASALSIEPISLPAVAEQSWEGFATPGASLEVDTDQMVQADRGQLQHLMENLLRNAVEHAGDEVTVRVGDLPDGFFVEDDGPGISGGPVEDVFKAGFSSTPGGTGFGLSIVKQVVNAHGWNVRVTESPAGGARFEITGVEKSEAP